MKTNINQLLNWSEPKRIMTRNGERDLLTATPTSQFWSIYRSNKAALKEAGISPSKNDDGEWSICWWRAISEDEAKERSENAAASRACSSNADLECPQGLEYYPFQKAGIKYALDHSNTLIADDMGLGKTVQAIGVINNDQSINRVLVICPASVKRNWEREMKRWLVRDLSISVWNGKCNDDADIVIINYDILSKHADFLRATDWDVKVLDEVHYAKNPKALRTKLALSIESRRTIALTGTPIVNRPNELWPILHHLDSKRWRYKGQFERRYCAAHQTRFGWDATGASNLDELQNILRETLMIRRLKSQVLTELPAKRRQIVTIESDSFKDILKDQDEIDLIELESQFRNDALDRESMTVIFEVISKIRKETAIRKIPHVIKWIDEILLSVDKVIVFAHHHELLDAIKDEYKWECVGIDGRTPSEERQAVVDKFQNDERVKIFVGGIRSAGEGITLTSASIVLFAEIDWTPGKMTQAEDRAHRIGQSDSVHVFHLVVDGSIDDLLIRTIVEKQQIIEKALDRETVKKTHDAAVSEIELIEKKEQAVSEEWREKTHAKLKFLASCCDGARAKDGMGFNGLDSRFGKALAAKDRLTDNMVRVAHQMLAKYKKQLEVLSL